MDRKSSTWIRHSHDLSKPQVDKEMSNAGLERGQLFPEAEDFQAGSVIRIKNSDRYIIKSGPNKTKTD